MVITDPSGRLVRWRLRLAEFHFLVKYKKENHNCFVDFLSRMRTSHQTTDEIDEEIPFFAVCYDPDSEGTEPGGPWSSGTDNTSHQVLLLIASTAGGGRFPSAISAEKMLHSQLQDPFCASL